MTPATPAVVNFESEPVLTRAGHRLLDAASALFYARGIRAVGVDLIADEAGTTKKTLYDCFGSKDALVALYLRRRAIRWQEFLRSRSTTPATPSTGCAGSSTPSRSGTSPVTGAAPSSTRTPRSVPPTTRRSR